MFIKNLGTAELLQLAAAVRPIALEMQLADVRRAQKEAPPGPGTDQEVRSRAAKDWAEAHPLESYAKPALEQLVSIAEALRK